MTDTCGSCAHFMPHPSIHGEYGDCTLHHHVTTIDLSCESHIEGPNNPDPETQAGLNAIMAAQFTTPPNPCSTTPSPHHPRVQP